MSLSPSRGIVVFSGGSAANHLVDVFSQVIEAKACTLSYVIPISDNGGSSSELIRVVGGPGIGDIRSRLVRLIPDSDFFDPERNALKTFFNYRLPIDSQAARIEWLDIVEARHELWKNISSQKKELVRSFLNYLNLEIVKRARPTSVFNFQNASVGNLFLTGARLFCGSLESGIYLLSSICAMPGGVSVIPAINTNFSHHICAGLANGEKVMGQNAISHPSDPTSLPSSASKAPFEIVSTSRDDSISSFGPLLRIDTDTADKVEDANLPGSLPTLRQPYISFSKDSEEDDDLPARISRVWYINPYGQEIRPPANPRIMESISRAQSIIYSIGSLYTSLIPSLVLRGVGQAISSSWSLQKILILNGDTDRETGPSWKPFTAIDFVTAIAKAGLESQGIFGREPEIEELKLYVTHVIHLEGSGTPVVDRLAFHAAGIETIRIYGRRATDGKGSRYDPKALSQALEALVGRQTSRNDLSRRNTLER